MSAASIPDRVNQLIAELQSADDAARGAAWQGAETLGAPAIKPLAALLPHADFEVARSARRALWKIVRYAGRPGAGNERAASQTELLALLAGPAAPVRREALAMLSEIGDDQAVEAIARWLNVPEVREAARCALERIPGMKSSRALRRALRTAPEDFRPALACSLRVRSHKSPDRDAAHLRPARRTTVVPK